MANVAVIIANMFEDSEYSEPVSAFRSAGHTIIHIGFKAGDTVKGLKKEMPVTIDKAVKGLSIKDFDALLIPGGYSPDALRTDTDAVRVAREFVESGKPVFVICHGPQLLISACVLKGRKITGWKSVRDDLINAGAEFIDQDVVEDGNIISSRSPADLPRIYKSVIEKTVENFQHFSQRGEDCMERFQDRADAGMYLADRLQKYANKPDTIVLGLPRGGVVVAFEVAQALGLPLDIFLVRKLGVPGYEELALGAIASGGVQVINQDVLNSIRISPAEIQNIAAKEAAELKRRESAYRENRLKLDVKGRTVILIDDGLATGATMRAAVEALGKMSPRKIVVAVPVASVDACNEFRTKVDELVCGITPAHFNAVGAWYEDFSQTSDKEVVQLLRESETFGQTAEAM